MKVTFEDLQDLSGYTQPAAIRAWMARNGIPFVLDCHGRPVTTQNVLDRAIGGSMMCGQPQGSTPDINYDAPRWDIGAPPQASAEGAR